MPSSPLWWTPRWLSAQGEHMKELGTFRQRREAEAREGGPKVPPKVPPPFPLAPKVPPNPKVSPKRPRGGKDGGPEKEPPPAK